MKNGKVERENVSEDKKIFVSDFNQRQITFCDAKSAPYN